MALPTPHAVRCESHASFGQSAADIRKITQEKMRLAAGEWNQMAFEEKQVYEDRCKSEKDAYMVKLKSFKEQLSQEDMAKLQKFKESLQKYRKEQKDIKAGTYIEVRVCVWLDV